MKRFTLCLAAGLLAFLVSAPAASAFSWKDVIKMQQAGVADSLIIQKIDYSGTTFHLGGDEIAALKKAGVSDEIVSAMLRTEAEEGRGSDGYMEPYDAAPRSHVYVGLGFGFYDPYPWYYGGYGYPVYRSYYGHRYYGNRYYGRPHYRSYGSYGGHRYYDGWGYGSSYGGSGYGSSYGHPHGNAANQTTRTRTTVTPRNFGGSQGHAPSRPSGGGASSGTTSRHR
jgi:hypothetical protein